MHLFFPPFCLHQLIFLAIKISFGWPLCLTRGNSTKACRCYFKICISTVNFLGWVSLCSLTPKISDLFFYCLVIRLKVRCFFFPFFVSHYSMSFFNVCFEHLHMQGLLLPPLFHGSREIQFSANSEKCLKVRYKPLPLDSNFWVMLKFGVSSQISATNFNSSCL